jgi:hypothetical protein
MPLADTLLRMAESPSLYLPHWSHLIMDEVTRNLIRKWGMPADKARRREQQIRRHFSEAWVEDFEQLIDVMTNHPGDRHVLAAAVSSRSQVIVTYNKRHFPLASMRNWNLEVQGPSRFLRGLYDLEPDLFVRKLHEQAQAIGLSLEQLLRSLKKNAPSFADYFREAQGISIPDKS